MVNYYRINGVLCAGEVELNEPTVKPAAGERLVWLVDRPLEKNRTVYAVENARQLAAEGVDILNELLMPEAPLSIEGLTRCVNIRHPQWKDLLEPTPVPAAKKARVQILALGDVGGTLLTGLRLLGADVIESIGLFDLNENAAKRWEFEANQIAYPWAYDKLPRVFILKEEELFDCDLFIFVASKSIPPVGSGVKDVRMAQFEANRKIAAIYGRKARAVGYKGLYAAVSDPVDPLAKEAYLASNTDENGNFDGKGLRAEQIQGYGLGVMNARAAYYAAKDERFAQFLTEGRSFGPHGQDLVVANSIANYDDALSRELTEQVVTANLKLRAIGYKPYVAPAMSSGALSLLMTLRGEWHCGSVFMDGIFMGCKNRYTPEGLQVECLPLPQELYSRITHAADHLKSVN